MKGFSLAIAGNVSSRVERMPLSRLLLLRTSCH